MAQSTIWVQSAKMGTKASDLYLQGSALSAFMQDHQAPSQSLPKNPSEEGRQNAEHEPEELFNAHINLMSL
jgi:hypothetical protein